jgi:glycosyltransferase involved in cell wall biosynthesis
MKILFISDVYFPRVNGVSTSIETFRHELRKLGHTVHLIAPDYLTPSRDESDILRLPARNIPLDPEDRFMRYGVAMGKLDALRQENYDIIHIQTPFVAHYLGVQFSRLLAIPCVETYHTFFEEYLHHYIPFMPKKLMRHVARRFSRHQGNSLHGMIVPSHPMRAVLTNYGITTLTQVIPTGMEPASFVPGNRAAFRGKFSIPESRPLLLFLGRVAFEKNIGFLLEVLVRVRSQVPDVLLIIAGEGPARLKLEQQAERLGLNDNIMFIGYLDRHTELNDCYCAADLFIFASRTETQGLVLLEAMAQGTAVVSTAELGTLDVLKDRLGVLIAQEDVSDFSDKVTYLLKDAGERRSIGEAGRIYAMGWSASRQAERLEKFYGELISSFKQKNNINS